MEWRKLWGTGGEGAHHTEVGRRAGDGELPPLPVLHTKPPGEEPGHGAGGHGNPSARLPARSPTASHRWGPPRVAGAAGEAAAGRRPQGLPRVPAGMAALSPSLA